jgi:hypothetical protein
MRITTVGLLSIFTTFMVMGGCRKSEKDVADAKVDLVIAPSPPTVGEAAVALTLAKPDDEPLSGAEVRIEGNMNHAGMKPSFADLKEEAPGRYVGTLDFTMGGDWFVLVSARLPDGGRLERKIDVPGVKAP